MSIKIHCVHSSDLVVSDDVQAIVHPDVLGNHRPGLLHQLVDEQL